MISASSALKELRDGNLRFASTIGKPDASVSRKFRSQEDEIHAPIAIVVACSDSNLPVEIIFDQGPGRLYVNRIGANVVPPSIVGSIEFSLQCCSPRLIVVLGHSHCGLVVETIDALLEPPQRTSRNVGSLVNRVRPLVEGLLAMGEQADAELLIHDAVRANIRGSADQLRHGSPMIEDSIQNDGLVVVGAEYQPKTRIVDFFDGV